MTKKKIILILTLVVVVASAVTYGIYLRNKSSSAASQAAISKSIDDYYNTKPSQVDPEALDKFNKNSKALKEPVKTSPCFDQTKYEVVANNSVSCVNGGD